jgi:hypothetical protein
VYCLLGSGDCEVYEQVSDPQDWMAACTMAGNGSMVVSACPTTALDGCCAVTDTGNDITQATCYYAGNASAAQANCAVEGGSWSTSIP